MTVALWCVLVAGLLHLPFASAAKWSSRFDNHHPRDFLDQTTGWRKRAHWAQMNMLEAFPLFAVAVLIAHLIAGPSSSANGLALSFIGFRIAFGLCYILDKATLRSLMWVGGLLSVVGLFVVAARAA